MVIKDKILGDTHYIHPVLPYCLISCQQQCKLFLYCQKIYNPLRMQDSTLRLPDNFKHTQAYHIPVLIKGYQSTKANSSHSSRMSNPHPHYIIIPVPLLETAQWSMTRTCQCVTYHYGHVRRWIQCLLKCYRLKKIFRSGK